MDKNRTKQFTKKFSVKLVSIILMVTLLLDLTAAYIGADSYYTVRVNYLYVDGTHAHDPYIATFPAGQAVDVTVTNPNVSGYDPMMLNEGEKDPRALPENGVLAKTTAVKIDKLEHNVTYTVYYLAGLSHYRARYYLQNVYDDLYTTDQTLNAQYQDLLGVTGSFPTHLEEVEVEGFTSLFHEPDAIAADGSTVFRLYYDRNYYTVGFDLGEGGYGVEPIYAKYQTVYHVDEPKRLGYTFRGWARTDIDSAVEGADWHYINENGNIISEAEATATENLLTLEGDQTIPAKNTYYKAMWDSGTTSYSVVYWIQNPTGRNLTTTELNAAGSIENARAMIAENYTVVAAKDVTGVRSGEKINLDTVIKNAAGQDTKIKCLFPDPSENSAGFDLSPQAVDEVDGQIIPRTDSQGRPLSKDNKVIDFPAISEATSSELVGKEKYYYFEEDEDEQHNVHNISSLQFGGAFEEDQSKQYIEVQGDGTTRINVYYNRKEYTLKFFYARQNYENGQLTNTYSLTNGTKDFSKKDYGSNQNYMEAVAAGSWEPGIAGSLPCVKDEYLKENGGILEAKYIDYTDTGYDKKKYRYYYYEVKAKYNEPLSGKWLIDAVSIVPKKDYSGQNCEPGSWAVERFTKYYDSHTSVNNFTVKGIYEKLGDELMFKTKENTLQELHYLLSWTNTSTDNKHWNYGTDRILHFTYENYIELLPRELSKMEDDNNSDGSPDGPQALIDEGLYENIYVRQTNTSFVEVDPSAPFTYDSNKRYYGIKTENRIETTDSGSQYPINNLTEKTKKARSDQVPTDLTGFSIENKQTNDKGQIILDTSNTIVDWSDDTNAYRHATIKFFYHRLSYTLKWRNGNRLEKDKTRDVMYGAPLNSTYTQEDGEHLAGEYRYWYNGNPAYFNEDLREYYNFIGWYYTPYYYRMVDKDTATMPAYDMTLYAKWTPKMIDVVFYNNYNEYYEDTNRIVLGNDEENNPITAWTVEYGSYVPLNHIPADVHDESSTRPELTPIAEKASFAGWYYIRNRVPRRFEPENVPVTALNAESTGDNAKLRLFAEWVTQDVAKYKVSYVRADDPTVEVAPPTVGRAYVWKTRTFHAKSGDELSGDYKWTEEHEDEGTNWWPTVNSHSIIIKANEEGEEYHPNEYTFEYIQKDKVHYRVRYLDADTSKPINSEGHDIEKITSHASVKEDARVIPGYVADPSSATLILSASTAATPEEQKAEELRNNVITFLYHKNTTEYIYETEYYTHDLDGNGYSLFASESLDIPIAAQGDTTVAINDIFARPIPQQIIADGFERSPGKAEYTYIAHDGSVSENPIHVDDNGSVTIVDTDKKTIRLYFDRRNYSYSYEYVDHTAAKAYEQASESERENMWNGVLATFSNAGTAPVGATVTLNVPADYSYTNPTDSTVTAYTRLTNADGTLNDVKINIQPAPDGSLVNHIKIYYRKDIERDLNYRMICVNDNGETDYDAVTGDPLFGRLSVNRQTVESYDQIQNVTFYDTNNDTITVGNQEVDLHLHKYTFLGWYSSPDYNEDNPSENLLTTNMTLSKEALGTNGSLPDRDTKYYALVKQEMVQMDVDFYFCDDYTKTQMYALSDGQMKAYLQQKINNNELKTSGEYGGKDVIFDSPSLYQNHTQIAWHKNDGYSLHMKDVDNRVYKYEFAEWWEIDEAQNNDLIPKHNWNGGEWSPDSLASQLSRTKNQHLIAVYARREVTELPYTLNYNFISRTGEEKTYVKKGTLTGDDLDEKSENPKITTDGFYALTDEFILSNAPYESNFAEVLNWTDHPDYVIKNSVKGDGTEGSVDRIVTDVNAVQSKKNVFANFRTTPIGEYQTISIPYGSNYKQSENMLDIVCPETYEGMSFAYWEVRKTETGPVIAKSYDTLFDLCMMDTYWITPVYSASETADHEAEPVIKLTHIDDTRNTWTDENNEVPQHGSTDILYTDFEIAFDEGTEDYIYNAAEGTYRTGVVFELCATLPAGKTFEPGKDYGLVSNENNLKEAILSNAATYNYNPDKPNKLRSLQISEIPQSALTNHDRVQYGKSYRNTYKYVNKEKTYINARYLLKATAYLVKGDKVTLSNSVYICLAAEADKNLAIDSGIVTSSNNG